MSHEIRTPMTAILGFAENLLDPGMSESERLKAAQTICTNGDHLLQIINDILDVSKVEVGKLEVECIRFAPVQVVAEVKSLAQCQAHAKDLSFNIEYTGPFPETIKSDPTRLRQILVNLVGNAIKFTNEGGVRLVMRFVDSDVISGTEPGEPKLQFDVIDSGIGMTPEQMGRLFRPFSQADSSTTRRFGGSGLGLAISKHLANMLGGDIMVESEHAKGSLFRVTIETRPLQGVRMLDDPAFATIVRSEPAPPERSEQLELDCRILLVEDSPDNQRLIDYVLQKAGAEVVIVENGKLAVNLALGARDEGNPFDAILMDMQMPVMDGYEATMYLRQRGYDGPIIALTAHAMGDDRDKCIKAGCDAYATKPINRKELVETIREQVASASVA
jgi:CheY-like chemotaxis protein